jgi:hypothetical protein
MNDNHECNIFISRLLSRTSIVKPTKMHSNRLESQPSSLQYPLSSTCFKHSSTVFPYFAISFLPYFARQYNISDMSSILPSIPEAFKSVRNLEEFDAFLCRYLPSAQMDKLCPLWNLYALPVISRL